MSDAFRRLGFSPLRYVQRILNIDESADARKTGEQFAHDIDLLGRQVLGEVCEPDDVAALCFRKTVIIRTITETYDLRFGDLVGIVEVPKSEAEVSADQRDEADRIDDLAHALADHFGRKVVLVWPDDEEVVVEPRPELRLDG